MNKIVNPKHILGIDLLRFIAALLVMLFHYGFLLNSPSDQGFAANQYSVSFPELADYSFFGFVGVQIFFVISGFVIAFTGERASSTEFVISRMVRLVPGVWLCGTITLIAWLLVGNDNYLHVLQIYVRTLIFFPFGDWIDGAYWTLGVEIAFYSGVWLLICFNKFNLIRYLAIAIGLLSTLFWCLSALGLTAGGGEHAVQAVNTHFLLSPDIAFNIRRLLVLNCTQN